jgi:hypothetical protein
VYIMATAGESIVKTLEFFPHNSPMSQMSSTDRILMAAQDMTDALKHTHHDVPFATIGDDTIAALEKCQKSSQGGSKIRKNGPYPRAGEATWYTMGRRARGQHTFSTNKNHINRTNPTDTHISEGKQPPPRVFTPATMLVSPPRVKARAQHLSPRNLSRVFLDLGAANCACASGENHWTKTPMIN